MCSAELICFCANTFLCHFSWGSRGGIVPGGLCRCAWNWLARVFLELVNFEKYIFWRKNCCSRAFFCLLVGWCGNTCDGSSTGKCGRIQPRSMPCQGYGWCLKSGCYCLLRTWWRSPDKRPGDGNDISWYQELVTLALLFPTLLLTK